jgi:hypothetical protein
MSKLVEHTQQMLHGEDVRYVFTCQKGINPSWAWMTFGLLRLPLPVANRARIVAITRDAVVVMAAGQLRWNRKTPKRVLYRVPRATLGPLSRKAWTHLDLGQERIWVPRVAYSVIEEANAEIVTSSTAVASGAGSDALTG